MRKLMKVREPPPGATHRFPNTNRFYRYTGDYSTNGYPKLVRWIWSRNAWAKTPLSIVTDYIVEVEN